MKKRGYVSIGLGILLVLFSVLLIFNSLTAAIIPGIIGLSLIYLGWANNRRAMIIFGHCLIVIGAYLITWGLYMLPSFKPVFQDIVLGPLFWGIFSLMGGICANYHGFCKCINSSKGCS
ncbi:MAG: hypothetical protein RBS43_00860 [Candidatus Cloacimonas sp.]|jgi:hypothetical protein|nr:hypothetical protein [Candidatus Cloacimonas sp.]